jgi:hypothetical protein
VGTANCIARNEGSGTTTTPKTFAQNNTNADVAVCVEGNIGGVGYVNAARSSTLFYSVPTFGIDPDTNDLREMVKCGMWPYWGPLTGGTGIHSGFLLSNTFVAAHLANLRNQAVFSTGEDYLPLGGIQTGVAFDKATTANFYKVKFTPSACPGTFAAPDPHP